MQPVSLNGTLAVVTGATRGIGLAIAQSLAANGALLVLIARDRSALQITQQRLGSFHTALVCDLSVDADLLKVRDAIVRQHGRLDILIHCAGVIAPAPLGTTRMDDFDRHYRINARAPLLLTQALLPLLEQSLGQIVFVNSTLGVRTKEGVGAYAASKHALKAIADTLRAELYPAGIRVLSVFPGNTATPMQQGLHESSGKPYSPDQLLQPSDVAALVTNALQLPRSAEVPDIHILPTHRASSGSSGMPSGSPFSSVDTNNDGKISRSEWDAYFNKSGTGASGSSG